METKTVSSRMHSLLVLFNMHTTFFQKAIAGISDQEAHNRLNTKANHVAWLAGSLVEQRYEIAKELGINLDHASHVFFEHNKGIQDNVTYPSLNQYKQEWETISPLAEKTFVEVTDEALDRLIDMGGMKMTLFDLLSFVIYREANCIGQIALWRRLLGYEALKYDE